MMLCEGKPSLTLPDLGLWEIFHEGKPSALPTLACRMMLCEGKPSALPDLGLGMIRLRYVT
jgi:hypothetical protein